ncbi:MAG: hypothetical protein ACOYJD_04815 [Christensenellales bacterium]
MLFLFFAALLVVALMLLPLGLRIDISICGAYAQAVFSPRLFGVLPVALSVHASIGLDSEAKVYIITPLGKKNIKGEVEEATPKIRTKDAGETRKRLLKWIRKIKKAARKTRVSSLYVYIRVGIKERADITAILTGIINAAIRPGAAMLYKSGCRCDVRIIPLFGKNSFRAEASCIIKIAPVHIIIAGLSGKK